MCGCGVGVGEAVGRQHEGRAGRHRELGPFGGARVKRGPRLLRALRIELNDAGSHAAEAYESRSWGAVVACSGAVRWSSE